MVKQKMNYRIGLTARYYAYVVHIEKNEVPPGAEKD